jgi:hypothetical protein
MDLGLIPAIKHALGASEEAASLHAASEAADTGSAVLKIRAIQIRKDSVIFVGTMLVDALQVESESPGAARTAVRPRGFGKLHRASGALTSSDPIGFLVLHHPVRLVGGWLPEEAELISVAVEVARRPGASEQLGAIGPVCCGRCNEPIAEQRLKPIPSAKRCTRCQV